MRQVLSLIGTGVVLGIVHVLTGPDHLSALATLSANVGNVEQAAWLGIRWGIGHSTGLLLVAIILILINHPSNDEETIEVPRFASIFFESLVGIFLIFLGIYGIHRAQVKRSDTYRSIPSVHNFGREIQPQQQQMSTILSLYHVHTSSPLREVRVEGDNTADIEMLRQSNEAISEQQPPSRIRSVVGWTTKLSTRTMAIVAGIIHGLAGPGGVLGVIPAIQLQNGKLAAIYLLCFCITSTITMGIFAAMYGSCSSGLTLEHDYGCRPFLTDCNLPSPRIREFQIECASAGLSIFVGVMWLLLLALGKLDEIFP